MSDFDIAVIGGGPAGMAAASEAARHGARVVLLDEQGAPGGQVYRAIEARAAAGAVDPADAQGPALAAEFRASGAHAEFNAAVWLVEPDGTIGFSRDGEARLIQARRVILATGAIERPLPIPGWTLPGVMTVGAAQTLYKTAGLVPQGQVWLAGQGPLLLLYATQALDAGAKIAGILDLGAPANRARAALRAPWALAGLGDLKRGLAWRKRLRAAGLEPIRARALRGQAMSDGKLGAITYEIDAGARRADADLLLLHDGVVPNIQISQALGLAHDWDETQRCFRPRVDAWGVSSAPAILIAGDGGGIAGAKAAVFSGRIAALEALRAIGAIDEMTRDVLAQPHRRDRALARAIRPFLDALTRPITTPIGDDTIVCRCEEVPAGALREAVALGCLGPNQLKSFTRCGMGPCQGRMCGPSVTAVMAEARRAAPQDIGYFRLRFPIKPLTMGELAALHGKT